VTIRVPLWGAAGRFASLDPKATEGATIGLNVRNADGTLFDPAAYVQQAVADTVLTTGYAVEGAPVLLWSLVQNIPANVVAVGSLATDGFVRRSGNAWTASAIVNADLADADTDGLAEGATNLYFTDLRARAANAGVSKTLAYDGSDRLSVVTDARGTKTMTYDGSDRLTSVTGTGEYQSKTFTYTGDQLTAVTVT
jgi:YD repeat-containing protein